MRVMHVMAGAAEGGAENIMLESVLALAETDLAQHVVTRPDNAFRIQKFREAGIGVDVAAFNNSWPFPTQRVIADAIKQFEPDVIEYWMGRAGQFAPKQYRARSIGWYGGYYKLARFKNCEWHVGLTIDLLRHIREQGVSDERSAIVHTYADFTGLDTLLDATAKIDGLYVWIAGEGPLEQELKAHCARLGLDERVRFLGWRNDRGALLAACDVVAFPSRYEPFGTVTVDAWAGSRPLVAADAVGPAAYVKDGVNGMLIPKNDVDALADALRKVVTDKDLAAKLVAGGRASYEAQFTKAVFQRDSLALYQKIAAYAGPFGG